MPVTKEKALEYIVANLRLAIATVCWNFCGK